MAHKQTHPQQLPLDLGGTEIPRPPDSFAQELRPQILQALSALILQVARAKRASVPRQPKEVGDERKS